MCGIVGLIDASEPNIQGLVGAMRDSMVRRGPDGIGGFFEPPIGLAMRRLSVIDLEHGWQPLTSRDGEIVAFQNGEIYNHRDLRGELERRGFVFRTQSDTEVLAHGYAAWGIEGLLERVDGMYALAVLDRARKELHLARDRFGEKPLFYASEAGRFAFASSLLPLAALPWVDDRIHPPSLDRYLALHYVPGDRTILSGVRRALPGERLRVSIDDVGVSRARYYRPPLRQPRWSDDEELASEVEAAVRSRLVADVPVGVFLSGGLDSSIVAAVAARHSPRIDTFSMGFSSAAHDESRFAAAVAEVIGSSHHHFTFDNRSFQRLLPEVVATLDEPLGDQAMLPLYWLCREARRTVTVVLSGEGADELFAGYSYYAPTSAEGSSLRSRWHRYAQTVRRRSPTPTRLAEDSTSSTPSGFPVLTNAAERKLLIGSASSAADPWEDELLSWLGTGRDPLQQATAADVATWLPDDLLVKFDRMAMAHSLEGRAPYLQRRLAERALHLPAHMRMSNGTTKVALRQMAQRWLPQSILERPKQGFVLPMRSWLVEWFAGHEGARAYFAERPVPNLDTSSAGEIAVSDLRRGVQRERLLFALVALVEWHDSFRSRVDELGTVYRRTSGVSAGVGFPRGLPKNGEKPASPTD